MLRDMKLAVIAGFVISCLNLCQVYGRQVTEPIDGRNQDPTYRYVKPSLIKELLNAGQDIRTNSSKGLEYYLNNYGPLAKVIVTDFMDSFGFARNLQLAIPIVAKNLGKTYGNSLLQSSNIVPVLSPKRPSLLSFPLLLPETDDDEEEGKHTRTNTHRRSLRHY
ncbi:uncharacterized protein [Macrobrachium rosenbergii]|uniref:uncharacterized protein isoform X4 n=1 Tax=Macrobrachium rosenbergii TaxID=79674 RepID=UPI0034D6F677